MVPRGTILLIAIREGKYPVQEGNIATALLPRSALLLNDWFEENCSSDGTTKRIAGVTHVPRPVALTA
jgi:hypothetical protein